MASSNVLAIARHDTPPAAADRARDPVDLDRAMLEEALGRQYQVVRALGRGAMGSVYLARDTALHRVVAVKVLRTERMQSVEERERFRREARLAAQLAHPHIVPIYGFGETANAMYLVMRYVPGESLGARIAREGPLPADEVRRIVIELAHALEYAHRQGVIHRDLKPENILLDAGSVVPGDATPPRAMLADFGVAVLRMSDPVVGEVRRSFGTPHFMSPEQAAGEPDLDGRSDIYALGVLGYLMLSGVLPFEGSSSFASVAERRFADDRPPLASVAPRAPRDLVRIVERCLAQAPHARYGHARELAAALVRRGLLERVLRRGRA
jgi:serine/threonine-protein kinase